MASSNASFRERVFARVLLAPFKLLLAGALAIIGILVLAWIVDWVLVFQVWPEGVTRLRRIFASDLERGIELAALQGLVPGVISASANLLYAVVFRASGIHDMGLRFAQPDALSIPDAIVRNFYIANRDAIEVAMIGTRLVAVRLATILCMLPLGLLMYAVGSAGGMAERAIRRACGGRESASLYHRAKHLQVAAIALTVLTILAWPTAVNPVCVGVVLAVVVGILARIQWAYYKKHL